MPHTAVCHVLPPPLSWDWVIESLGVKPVTDRSWHNMSIIKACPWCPCDPVLAKGFPGQQGPAAFPAHKLVEVVLLFTSFNVLVWSSLGHLKVSLQTILEKIIFEGLYHTSQTLLTNIKTHYKSLPILVTNEQIQWSFAISFHFESQTDICLIDGFGYLYKEKGLVIYFKT